MMVHKPSPRFPDREWPEYWVGSRRIGPPASMSYPKAIEWQFNPGSPDQVAGLLNSYNEEGGPQTDRVTLLQKENDLLAKKIADYKYERKFQTAYCEPILRGGPRLRGSFNQVGTDTGRYSASGYKDLSGVTYGVNLQTLPRRIKPVLRPAVGNVLVEFDWSQIELRVLAHISQDPDLIGAYTEGRDIHDETQSRTGLSDRRIAKILNFNCAYNPPYRGRDGSAAYVVKLAAIKDGINLSFDECEGFVQAFRDAWPGVLDYYTFIESQIRAHRFVSTMLGRAYRCWYTGEAKLDKLMFRKAVNHPIQGTAADLLKLSLHELWNRRDLWLDYARIVNTVHDSIWFECQEEKLEDLTQIVQPVMEENYLGLDVPIKVDMEIMNNSHE